MRPKTSPFSGDIRIPQDDGLVFLHSEFGAFPRIERLWIGRMFSSDRVCDHSGWIDGQFTYIRNDSDVKSWKDEKDTMWTRDSYRKRGLFACCSFFVCRPGAWARIAAQAGSLHKNRQRKKKKKDRTRIADGSILCSMLDRLTRWVAGRCRDLYIKRSGPSWAHSLAS